MKVDVFMPLYLGDYLRDTGDLDATEHGAYLLILMAMWTAGGKLPLARLDRHARVPEARWPDVWAAIGRFFDVQDQEVTQRRLTRELARALALRDEAVRRGKASAVSRRAKFGSAQPESVSKASPKASRERFGAVSESNPERRPNPSPSPSPSQRASDPEARPKPPALIQSRHETFQQRDARIAREASEQTKVELARDVAATNVRLEGLRMDPSKAPTAEQPAGLRRKP